MVEPTRANRSWRGPVPCGRLSPPILGRFDGGVVCFRVYLEQPALALKLTKPALQLLIVHVLKRTQATSRESPVGAAQSKPATRLWCAFSFSLGFSMLDFQRASFVLERYF